MKCANTHSADNYINQLSKQELDNEAIASKARLDLTNEEISETFAEMLEESENAMFDFIRAENKEKATDLIWSLLQKHLNERILYENS